MIHRVHGLAPFIHEQGARWLDRFESPREQLLEIARLAANLPSEIRDLEDGLRGAGVFRLLNLRNRIHEVRHMPRGEFNAITRELLAADVEDVVVAMDEVRSNVPAQEPSLLDAIDALERGDDDAVIRPGTTDERLGDAIRQALAPHRIDLRRLHQLRDRRDGLADELFEAGQALDDPHSMCRRAIPEIVLRRAA